MTLSRNRKNDCGISLAEFNILLKFSSFLSERKEKNIKREAIEANEEARVISRRERTNIILY